MNPNFDVKVIVSEWRKEKAKSVKPTSMAAYNLIVNKHITPFFQEKREFNKPDIEDFMKTKLQEGISVKTVKDILVVLKMLINYAAIHGYSKPIDFKFNTPKELKIKDLEVFSPGQMKMLVEYLSKNISLKNLGILICLNTGLRIGEICALQWKDLDVEKGTLTVNKTLYRVYNNESNGKKTELILSTPKTRHSLRLIPLPDLILRQLKILKPENDKDKYVLTNTCKPLEPRSYRNYYNQLVKCLQLPELKFHCLRHSFATRCIESNCDYKTLSAILGHADISTTLNLYVHPSNEQKKKCIEQMINSL